MATTISNNGNASFQMETLGDTSGLSRLLKSNAMIRGVSVPLHRFSFLTSSDDGIELESIDLEHRLRIMWLSRFPSALIREVRLETIDPEDLPLIWIPERPEDLPGLIRGHTTEGLLVEVDGETKVRSSESLKEGRCFLFACGGNRKYENKSASKILIAAILERKRVFLEAIFATFMISALGIMSALYTMQVYDRVVPNDSFDTLIVLTIGVLIAVSLEWLMKIVKAQLVNRSAKAIDVELADLFFAKALTIRADRRPRTVGTFAAQVRQYEQVRSFATTATLFVLADAPFAFFFIGVIALIAGPVAFVPLSIIPIAVFVGWLIQLPIERLTRATIEESNKKNGLLIEAIDGIESVKSVASEWKLQSVWRRLTLTISKNELKSQILTNTSSATTQTFQQLSYIGIVAFGALRISEGELTIGGLIACSIIAGRALTPLAQIPQQIVQWRQATIGLQMLDSILALPDDREPGFTPIVPPTIDPGYRVGDLRFSYDEQKPIIQIESLKIATGERVALLGSVGSGKSTLLKLLAGLYHPAEGEISLGGLELNQISFDYLREQIGYLPQDVRLFNGTLRDNLSLGLPVLKDEDLLKVCKLTALDLAIAQHPRGLDLEISEGGKGLSGGQRQLVGLTRMLLARPKILLLDEPTASMDASFESFVMNHLFAELPKDTLVLVATHKANILNQVDRVLVLDRGQVVLDGPRDEVIARMQRLRNPGDAL
ncbi:MAG: ATP-binding cassette domain-containing protein [Betaproteobacteria bacterium]